jgi:hypothetical protein
MAKNLTNVHKKLDRLVQRLSAIDETQSLVRQIAQTNRYLSQIVNQNTALLREVSQQTRDIGTLAAEALRASRESAERTAEILAEVRKH